MSFTANFQHFTEILLVISNPKLKEEMGRAAILIYLVRRGWLRGFRDWGNIGVLGFGLEGTNFTKGWFW